MNTVSKSKVKAAPVVKPKPTPWENLLARATEYSTWAGLLSIGAVFATGGTAGWLNPETLPAILSGLGLVLVKEGK